jgi:hypothetical protein
MIHEYASNKWTSDLLAATSELAPPETTSIASTHQLQLSSQLENSSTASLLHQPATVEDSLACTELLPQGGRKEDCCSVARKNAESRQLASCYNERSARYPAGASNFKQTALSRAPHSLVCYEEDAISSPPLLALASPLQEGFPSVCIRHAQLPWSSVILTTVIICYSRCLRILTSYKSMIF